MNIAIYQPRVSYYVGGGEVLPLDHAVFLKKLGHAITIITTRASWIKESEYFRNFKDRNKNIRIEYLDLPPRLRSLYNVAPGQNWARWNKESLRVGAIAKKYFSGRSFDIMVVYNVVDLRAVPKEQKSVVHLLGYPKRLNELYRSCLRSSDTIIAVSEHVKRAWLRMIRSKMIQVAENGIRSDIFKPMPKKQKYDVLFVGRLIKIKGVEYLLRAIHRLAERGNTPTVGIVGIGPERERLESLVDRLDLKSSVHFIGRVTNDQLIELYNSARIAVLPSYDREGILITMLESSSCGTPVVTTTAGSMKEFIVSGDNGLLVRPKNTSDLATAIKRLCGDEKLRRRLSCRARLKIVRCWDWKIRIKKIEKIYETILAHN